MQIVIVAALILLNGVLSMSEFAIVSSHRHVLRERADSGSAGARAALLLSEQPGRFLSTVQIGITLVGILAGTFGGAAIAGDLAAWLRGVGVGSSASVRLALVIVVAATSYFTLVLGELVPKQIAIRNPDGVAARMAIPMRVLAAVTLPLVVILSASSRLILSLLGQRSGGQELVSEDEVRMMLHQGAEEGIFRRAEAKMIESVFRLDDIRADAIMTPRVEVVWLAIDADRNEIARAVRSRHGVFPVCEGTIDNVVGVVSVTEIADALLNGQEVDLRSLLRPVEAIPESSNAAELLHRIAETGTSFLVIVGEHGGLDGIATTHDLAEAVLGDLGPAEAQRLAPGHWLIAGSMPVEEAESVIGARGMRGTGRRRFGTLGGFVMNELGQVPRGGEAFSWGAYRFSVRRMAGRRIREVEVEGTPESPDRE